jgi:hypothetical protein
MEFELSAEVPVKALTATGATACAGHHLRPKRLFLCSAAPGLVPRLRIDGIKQKALRRLPRERHDG